jgi:hypothetical protein
MTDPFSLLMQKPSNGLKKGESVIHHVCGMIFVSRRKLQAASKNGNPCNHPDHYVVFIKNEIQNHEK